MPVKRRGIKETLTAIELDKEDTLELTLSSGEVWTMKVLSTGAEVISTTLKELLVGEPRARTEIRFWCDVLINGKPQTFEREISTQKSFYEPWVCDGVRIWLDAVDDVFNFMKEIHDVCRTSKVARVPEIRYRDTRFALQEEGRRICPDTLAPWCPLPEGGLKIEDCYSGEDCWMGSYYGVEAHGGLDINHPKGTPLFAPLDLDDNYLYGSVELGNHNNAWRGIRRWGNGCEWILGSAHMIEQTVPEHQPLEKGTQYAVGAGTAVGSHEHSHFVFRVYDDGDVVLLDPWILFWQMYQDQAPNKPDAGDGS